MKFLGYVYDETGRYTSPAFLDDEKALFEFIKANWEVNQLIITDSSDQQLLIMRDGVDLFNQLNQFGIQLSDIFHDIRDNLTNDHDTGNKPEWELLYNSIGLSAGEIQMRQRVKRACKAAKTVSDVIKLVQGTYFDVSFVTKDGQRCWGYFDEMQCSATVLIKDYQGFWSDSGKEDVIPQDARVVHLRSGEDVHEFTLLDPPGENQEQHGHTE